MTHPTRFALGLTRGSVRAILAIIITVATIAALLASLYTIELSPAAGMLALLDQKVLGDYFDASRKADAQPPEPTT